jgi:hypothetical protein
MTPKEEVFAQAIADGNDQCQAYRLAYDVSPHTKMTTIYPNASRLMRNSKIIARVAELRAELSAQGLWTRKQSVEALKEVLRIGAENKRPLEIIAAVKALNAMYGYDTPPQEPATNKGSQLPAPTFYVVTQSANR